MTVEPRVLVLAAALTLVVVAIVGLAVAVARSSRARPPAEPQRHAVPTPGPPSAAEPASVARPIAEAPSATAAPSTRVERAIPPIDELLPAEPPVASAAPVDAPHVRPVAHVRALPENERTPGTLPSTPASEIPMATSRELAPDFIPAAPIEMWFGEVRVGVKTGTKTYRQFRRYADALLGDLDVSRRP